MHIKNFLVALTLVTIATAAQAVERRDFSVPQAAPTDLVHETAALKLDQEAGVQTGNPPSHLFLSFLGGVTHPGNLSVQSNGTTVNYDFQNALPLASVQFTHYLLSKGGKWGWAGSLGYSYTQTAGPQATALHVLPVGLNLVYRGEFKDTQKFIPFVMAGPASWIYVQRGLDEYNTSQALLMGTATAGLSVNLNRLGWLHSRNDTEIILQYQRGFDTSSNNADLSGNTFQLGGSLAL